LHAADYRALSDLYRENRGAEERLEFSFFFGLHASGDHGFANSRGDAARISCDISSQLHHCRPLRCVPVTSRARSGTQPYGYSLKNKTTLIGSDRYADMARSNGASPNLAVI